MTIENIIRTLVEETSLRRLQDYRTALQEHTDLVTGELDELREEHGELLTGLAVQIEEIRSILDDAPLDPVPDPGPPAPTPAPPTPVPPVGDPSGRRGRREVYLNSSSGWPLSLQDGNGITSPGTLNGPFVFGHIGNISNTFDPLTSREWTLGDHAELAGRLNLGNVFVTLEPSVWQITDRSPEHRAHLQTFGRTLKARQEAGDVGRCVASIYHEPNGEWVSSKPWSPISWWIDDPAIGPVKWADAFRFVAETIRETGADIEFTFAPAMIWQEHKSSIEQVVERAIDSIDYIGNSWYPHSVPPVSASNDLTELRFERFIPNDGAPDPRPFLRQFTLERQLDYLARFGRTLCVNETGFGHELQDRPELIADFFAVLSRYRIDHVKYFNRAKLSVGGEQDYRLFKDSDPIETTFRYSAADRVAWKNGIRDWRSAT